MGIDTWWGVLIAWTMAGLLAAIAFGRVARNNEDREQDTVLEAGMPVANTANVSHFRRHKRKVAVDAATPHQASRDNAKRKAK